MLRAHSKNSHRSPQRTSARANFPHRLAIAWVARRYTRRLSFPDIAAIAQQQQQPPPQQQAIPATANNNGSTARSAAGSVANADGVLTSAQMSETALRVATANMVLNRLHRYSTCRGSAYWPMEMAQRLRMVTLIEQRDFVRAATLLQVRACVLGAWVGAWVCGCLRWLAKGWCAQGCVVFIPGAGYP